MLNKDNKDQNFGFFIESNDDNSCGVLFGVYEYEESDLKYVPIRESTKVFQKKKLSENKDNLESIKPVKQKDQKDNTSENSDDKIYDDSKDEKISLSNLLGKKRKEVKSSVEGFSLTKISNPSQISLKKMRKESKKFRTQSNEKSYNEKYNNFNSNKNHKHQNK